MGTFGERLRMLRKEKGMTGQELGKVFNVTKTAVSNWENGNRFPDENILKKISDYFNVSIDYLLGRTDIRNPYNSKNTTHPEGENLDKFRSDFLKKLDDLSEESKKELEKYIQLLKIKDQVDKSKDEQSSALEKEA